MHKFQYNRIVWENSCLLACQTCSSLPNLTDTVCQQRSAENVHKYSLNFYYYCTRKLSNLMKNKTFVLVVGSFTCVKLLIV